MDKCGTKINWMPIIFISALLLTIFLVFGFRAYKEYQSCQNLNPKFETTYLITSGFYDGETIELDSYNPDTNTVRGWVRGQAIRVKCSQLKKTPVQVSDSTISFIFKVRK